MAAPVTSFQATSTPADGARLRPAPLGIVDLFAGIGCVARGFERTRLFETIALVDIDLDARRTYLANVREADYLPDDASTLTLDRLLESADGRDIVGVVGCPPCQGFSAAGRRRADDERNALLGAFFAVVAAVRPLFFVVENVPAILYRPELATALAEYAPDYAVASGVLNAAFYGLPQSRQRAIIVGFRRDLEIAPGLPQATHCGTRAVFDYRAGALATPLADGTEGIEALMGLSPHIGVQHDRRQLMGDLLGTDAARLADLVRVEEAIGDLPALTRGGREELAPSAYALSLEARIRGEGPANHEPRVHARNLIARMKAVPEGGSPAQHRRYYSQAYTRLHRHGLARTITTNFHNAGSGRFTHYAEDRTLSVREAARLQGIEDSFVFQGSAELQQRLIGNAFPPPLAEAIARDVARRMDPVL